VQERHVTQLSILGSVYLHFVEKFYVWQFFTCDAFGALSKMVYITRHLWRTKRVTFVAYEFALLL